VGFFGSTQWEAPPGLGNILGTAQGWAQDPGTNWANKYLAHLDSTDPIKHQKAWNTLMNDPTIAGAMMAADSGQRDADRNYQMSTAVMGPGSQALRAATQGVMDTRAADNKGILQGNLVGQRMRDLQNQSNWIDQFNWQKQATGMEDWLRGEGMYRQQYKPGILDRIGQVAGVAGQIAGDVMGFGGFGGGNMPGNIQSGGFSFSNPGAAFNMPTSGTSTGGYLGAVGIPSFGGGGR